MDYRGIADAVRRQLTSQRTPYRRGDDIVIVHRVAGRLADGTPHEMTVADVFTVRDRLVVRMQAYTDPAEALA